MRQGYEDAVLRLHGPIITRAAQEFPAALAAIGAELGLRPSALGLLGGSAGAGVAQLVLAEQTGHLPAPVHAAVLVSPVVRLRAVVAAGSRRFGTSYAWSPAATEVADRLDFVARVDDVAAGQPAIRLVVGAEDDEEGFGEPAAQLRTALADRYDDPARVDLATVTGMAHAFAEEPGTDPAPQTPAAVAVDRLAEQWLGQHLPAEERDRDRAGVVW
jgi:acetyl esterase/lipase